MGRLGAGLYHEVRVHGVAGTTPDSTLRTAARRTDRDCECNLDAEIYRAPLVGEDWRAYSWSSLTSGKWYTALYLLLVPFMFANVAGWMLLSSAKASVPDDAPGGSRPWSVRVDALGVRVAGVLVTLVFALFVYLVSADLVAYQWLMRSRSWPSYWLGLGVLATAGVVWLLAVWTRPRPRKQAEADDPQWVHRALEDSWKYDDVDPFGSAWLHTRQAHLWSHPGIVRRLHRLHLAAAWGAIATVALWASPWRWLSLLAAALPVALLAVLTLREDGHGPAWLTPCIRYVVCSVEGPLVIGAAAWLWAVPPSAPSLPAVRGAGMLVALGLSALAILLWRRGQSGCTQGPDGSGIPRRAAWNASALLVIGASTGAALGAGQALLAEGLINRDCVGCVAANGVVPELAIGFSLLLGLVLWEALIRLIVEYRRVPLETPARPMVAVRAVTAEASWLTRCLVIRALLVLGVVALASMLGWSGGGPGGVAASAFLLIPLLIIVGGLAVVSVRTVTAKGIGALLLAVVSAALVIRPVLRFLSDLGFPFPPGTFLELAQLVTLVLPLGLVLTRMYAGVRGRDARRGIGILWDVGTFWPRWFHPFTPPTYSDRAVTDLTHLLKSELAASDRRMLLAPHSQGTVLAAAAILATPRPQLARLALLTYGSPLRRLYVEFYPAMFSSACLDELGACLGAGDPKEPVRWRNLYRQSDPIGGPIGPSPHVDPDRNWDAVDRGPLPDDDPEGPFWHSSYDLESDYDTARSALCQMLGVTRRQPAPVT
ncbi:MAG: hypothetical protein ACRDZO_12595 [Egibacteraceae bacterium]